MTPPPTRAVTPGLLGPVFRYELVRLGRQRTTFLLRAFYLLVLLIAVYMAYETWADSLRDPYRLYQPEQRRDPRLSDYSRFGTMLFHAFVPVQFLVLTFLTPGLIAGSIAVEKERKTLEFMLATDLRNREIVFGKLVARIVPLLMYALAGIPVIGIAMMFGGIDPYLLFAVSLGTLLTIFSLAALSVYFSVTQRKPRDAIALTYVVAGAYAALGFFGPVYLKYALPRVLNGPVTVLDLIPDVYGLPALASFLLQYRFGWDGVIPLSLIADWAGAGNPFYTVMHATGPAMARATASLNDLVVRFAVFHVGLGIILLTLSILRLRAVALHQAYGGTRVKKVKTGRAVTAKPTVGGNPILWRELFSDSPRGVPWAVLQVLLLAGVFIWPAMIFLGVFTDFRFDGDVVGRIAGRFNARYWNDFVEGVSIWVRVCTGVFCFLVCMAAALRGAGAITAEKDKDTWVSLIAAPVSVSQLVWGKFWGCVCGQRWLLTLLLLVWAFGLLVGSVHPVMVVPLVVYLAVYLAVFTWAGMFCSATARNTTVATLRAITLAGFLVGGHMIVGGVCCIWPMSIGPGPNTAGQTLASAFAGQIPPFVLGWLALPDFERPSMGIFHPNQQRSLGPLSPILGLFLWAGLAAGGYVLVFDRFRRAMNRKPDVIEPVRAKPVVRRADDGKTGRANQSSTE